VIKSVEKKRTEKKKKKKKNKKRQKKIIRKKKEKRKKSIDNPKTFLSLNIKGSRLVSCVIVTLPFV
jgi:hypothetical protein